MIKLFNCDCMEYMATVTDKYFDLAIVDPPYGIGNFQQSDGNYKPVKWNDSGPNNKFFNELKRVSKNRIIWGANYYNCFESGGIIWDKMNMHPSMSRCEIASYSGQKKIDYFQYEWYGYITKRITKGTIHPCEKPIALYKWLLKNYAKTEYKIIDTHLGSGSSAIACYDFGTVEFVGCEIDKDYFDASVKRILNYARQMNIFENSQEIFVNNKKIFKICSYKGVTHEISF